MIPFEVYLRISIISKPKLNDIYFNKVIDAFLNYFKKSSVLSTSSTYNKFLFMTSIHRVKIYSLSSYISIRNQLIDIIASTTNQMSFYIIKLFFYNLIISNNNFYNTFKIVDLINKNGFITQKGLEILDKIVISKFPKDKKLYNYDLNKSVSVLFDLISDNSVGIILNYTLLNVFTFL